MRPLRTDDALRCLLLNSPKSPNLAFSKNPLVIGNHSLATKIGMLKESFLPQQGRHCTLIRWKGLQVQTLGLVRVRSDPGVWEIERIHIGDDDNDGVAVELLERLSQYVGQRGAERIFLSMPKGSPLIEPARLAGFAPYLCEHLIQGNAGGSRFEYSPLREPDSLRPRQPHEEFALFQLYCASTPVSVRSALGITFDQWRNAREWSVDGTAEWVYAKDGNITGWLSLHPHRNASYVDLMVCAGEGEVLSSLVQRALACRQFQSWLLPEHQELARQFLIHKGFHQVGIYLQFVKWVAARVSKPASVTLEVSS